jgi:hypothetical protein
VSGPGHRASLPAGGHARPEYLAAGEQGTVVVRHHNREGRVREYDFSELPAAGPMQHSLAALFAARCTPGRWAVHATSMAEWHFVRQFTEFLARQQRPPRDLDELTPALVRQWRESLPAAPTGYRTWRIVSSLLRDDARLQAGPVADELARRRKIPPAKLQSYTEAEFDQFTAVARRQFRAALRRISDNALHLQWWREGAFAEGSGDWALGEGLDVLARTGDLPRYHGTGRVKQKYVSAFGGQSGAVTWQRLFLTREEAVALGVLLLAEFGWNLSVIDTMEALRAEPDQGDDGRPTYRVPLVKPRRGPGRHHESRNVTDDGAGSPGRLITQALQATRFARAVVAELAPGAGSLIAWRSARPGQARADLDHPLVGVGLFRLGISSDNAADWARDEGLGGSPFRRGRRTVIALDRREPAQHSRGTHDRHYVLPDERVQARAAEVIASGAEDAAGRAGKAVLAARLRDQAVPGDAETATADCSGSGDSPWPSPDGGCGASFLACLACPNARVHPGHHPRLAHLHEALGSLRSVLPPAAWAAGWRDACERLEDLRGQVGDGPWAHGLARVTSADREIVTHLLTGNLDR